MKCPKCDRDHKPPYTGAPSPLLERLVDRRWTPERSRLVDRWLQYRDLEFLTHNKEVA
jgi:hypothetical protein